MNDFARSGWIRGDSLGLDIPAHASALRAGGERFLTQAFHAAGSLALDNQVARITEFTEIAGGSTGRKLLLSVEYAKPARESHTDLFVKFSRDFDDVMRDQTRTQMELEVLFALLSRDPAFPIAVPVCYFSDYHRASGTGILITQRIRYGTDGVEPHYPKCLDDKMPAALDHYRAIVKALARLAGTHKAGKLSAIVETYFPFDPRKLVVSQRAPFTPAQIREKISAYASFAARYPQLLPNNICSGAFLKRLAEEAQRFQCFAAAVNKILQSDSDMIALCHWNAHVDNAWFWRNENDEIECGLLDWGNVSRMNVAMAIWGCLSGAEVDIWNCHLDELLALFIVEYERSGGAAIDPVRLKQHLLIYVAAMGLNWMLDTPRTLLEIPDLDSVRNRTDTRIENNERARAQLVVMTAFLNLWEKENMAELIDRLAKFEDNCSR